MSTARHTDEHKWFVANCSTGDFQGLINRWSDTHELHSWNLQPDTGRVGPTVTVMAVFRPIEPETARHIYEED